MSTPNKLTTLIIVALAATTVAHAQTASVAVSQIVEHPALDACRNGLLQGLADAGYKENDNLTFTFQTAQGKPDIAVQIAQQFVSKDYDVLVGIATPSAQALVQATSDIPVVFTAVTDPVGAKLIASMAKPGGNVTGISDLSPVAQHVDIMTKIVPGLQSIGVVYNPGEANSISLVEILKASASATGLKVIEGVATRSSEVAIATQSIADKVQIFYAITDNTIASAIGAHINAASDANVPVFAAETSYVDEGAIAAIGFDYYQIGYQTADYVVQILTGTKPADIPVVVATGTNIVINPGVASKLGITLPPSLTANPIRVVN